MNLIGSEISYALKMLYFIAVNLDWFIVYYMYLIVVRRLINLK